MSDMSDLGAAMSALRDPSTSGVDLAAIAQMYPSLRPQVAQHPNTYPALLDWLDGLQDLVVSTVVAARRSADAEAAAPASVLTARRSTDDWPSDDWPSDDDRPLASPASPAYAVDMDAAGARAAVDPVQPGYASSRAPRITAGVLFILGGLFGFFKLVLYNFEGCRASGEWDLGFHPLGWSSAMYFMCQNNVEGYYSTVGKEWEDSTEAAVFLSVGAIVLMVCGVICFVTRRITRAGIVTGALLAIFTMMSCIVAFIGMLELDSRSVSVDWFRYDGGYFLCVQYLLLLSIPVIFILVMASRSVITLRLRRLLLIVAMVFGAVVFPVLSLLLDFPVRPELGNILLIVALLVLAYSYKGPARASDEPQRQFYDG